MSAWDDFEKKRKCKHKPKHKKWEYCPDRDDPPIIPEPSSYGAIMMGWFTILFIFLRWRGRRITENKGVHSA